MRPTSKRTRKIDRTFNMIAFYIGGVITGILLSGFIWN